MARASAWQYFEATESLKCRRASACARSGDSRRTAARAALFADGFPELEQRYVRERDAAERVYEYNLGTIERDPGGIDETLSLIHI